MDILEKNNNIIIKNSADFNLRHIFDCGQCFRWDAVSENTYTGVAKARALTISEKDGDIIFHDTSRADFDNIWYDYFDFSTDYSAIKARLSDSGVMDEAISAGSGIRILRQDAWETIISFIISASNNIPRIKKIIASLCSNFGDEIIYRGNVYHSFPNAEKIASLSLEELSVIRAGFRDKYILAAAKAVAGGEFDISALYGMDEAHAKKALLSLYGVGNKVADCILLFGLHKCGAFPVDVWIKRIMEYCFFDKNDTDKKLISQFARDKFGELGGFAQQYLFYWARENKIGT